MSSVPPTDPLPPPDLDRVERPLPVLLRGGHLVDVVAGTLRRDTDLLIRPDGRIGQMGPRLAAPDATVVDVAGRYLLPGLISLHVHPGMMVGLRMDPDGQSPERIVRDLQVWLRHGVTTVQSLGADRPFGFDVVAHLRAGDAIGARLLTVGHGFGVQGGVPPFQMAEPGPVRLADPAAIRQVLDDLAARGASGVKLWYDDWYGQMPKMAPEVARTILRESHARGLQIYAHVYRVDDAAWLVREGVDVLAHMPRDRDVDQTLLDLMARHGTGVIPTLTVAETNAVFVERPAWLDEPLFERFLPPGSRAYLRSEPFLATVRAKPEFSELPPDLERALRNTARMHRAGLRVGFGTDAGVSNRVIGFSEHRELELLVHHAQLTPAEALRTATVASADLLRLGDEIGTLEPGRRADVVVLRADPLADIVHTRAVDAVWLDGVQVAGPL